MTERVAQPGSTVRAFRESRGWTLAEASRRTRLSVSTLSKIENNRVSLNFEKLSRLSAGLGIDIASLLDTRAAAANAPAIGRRSITRSDEGAVIETGSYRHVYLATDLLSKSFTPIIAEVRARSMEEFGELIRHPGEEFAYVLEGAIELRTDIYAPLMLQTGDSIFFDSSMGHAYLAAAPGVCRILSISTDLGRGGALAASATRRFEPEPA
jgi:transcriptional regulator with XRE-family HTH domain